jgi:predicted SAM-dependent methyltransferase
MGRNPRSRWVNVLARVGITIAAAGVLFLLRPDLRARSQSMIQSAYRRHVASPRLIHAYLRDHTVRKVQIGAGAIDKAGWLNTDIEPGENEAYLDASGPFPLPDGSFQYVFSEHVIEHLTYEQALAMLKECHRVLAPGGKLRIATPNLIRFLDLFQAAKTGEAREYIRRKLEWHELPLTPEPETYILNVEMRAWGHQFVYTPGMLRASLEAAGFRDVREFGPGVSDDPELAGVEARANSDVQDINAYETMVFQAVRR